MAGRTTSIDGLADAVMDGLKEYASLTTDTVKDASKCIGKNRKKGYSDQCPEKDRALQEKLADKENRRNKQFPDGYRVFQRQIPNRTSS